MDILKSGLQKYIRRGMEEKALTCLYMILTHKNSNKIILNRLPIIACEDISIGNINTVIYVLEKLFQLRKTSLKWIDVAPLVQILCRSEKTREFAHIYYALYADNSPIEKSLQDCIKDKDLLLIKHFKQNPQETIREFYLIFPYIELRNMIMYYYMESKEKEWFLGFILLIYLRNLKPEKYVYNLEIPIPNSNIEFDDFVLDKHTKIGRDKGKTLKDFVKEGSVIYPVSPLQTEEYKKIHDEMYGK